MILPLPLPLLVLVLVLVPLVALVLLAWSRCCASNIAWPRLPRR